MVETYEDPIEQDVLRQESERANMEEGKPGLLRVQSARSQRGGEEILWTEEIRRATSFKGNDSAETVIDEKINESPGERGQMK